VSHCRTVTQSQVAGPAEDIELTRDEGSPCIGPPSEAGCSAGSLTVVHPVVNELGNSAISPSTPVPTCLSVASQDQFALPLAPLTHMGIRINHLPNAVISLQDSGSEINVIKTSVLNGLSVIPVGRITFRGIVGEPVTADLVSWQIRLDESILNESDSINVIFAVCDQSNEQCILSLPTVYQLHSVLNNKLVHLTRLVKLTL